MIFQQLVRQLLEICRLYPPSLFYPIDIPMAKSFVCMWKSLALSSSDLNREFESECSDNLGLMQLLIANSNYSIRWAFESSFSISTVTRNLWSQSVVILAKWELLKVQCSNRKTCQVLITQLLQSHLILSRSHMKPRWISHLRYFSVWNYQASLMFFSMLTHSPIPLMCTEMQREFCVLWMHENTLPLLTPEFLFLMVSFGSSFSFQSLLSQRHQYAFGIT